MTSLQCFQFLPFSLVNLHKVFNISDDFSKWTFNFQIPELGSVQSLRIPKWKYSELELRAHLSHFDSFNLEYWSEMTGHYTWLTVFRIYWLVLHINYKVTNIPNIITTLFGSRIDMKNFNLHLYILTPTLYFDWLPKTNWRYRTEGRTFQSTLWN